MSSKQDAIRLHVTGRSQFIGDELPYRQQQVLEIIGSVHAHAKILHIETEAAKAMPGVSAVLTYQDIPGENQIGHVAHDEVLLVEDLAEYIGQPIVLIVAENKKTAKLAAKLVQIEYQVLEPTLTIEQAIEKESYYIAPRHIRRGEEQQAFEKAAHQLEGSLPIGGQEHYYLETQRCLAVPDDDHGITLYSATQSTGEVQEIAARVLGLQIKDVTVEVKRLGGAFGGKERAATIWACLTAVAAYVTNKPVLFKFEREQDILSTGKRHPYLARFRVGFSDEGKIASYQVVLYANGGAYTDLSIAVLERAMLHADNAYYLPNVSITGYACKTNLPPNTAFRGFGGPQGILAIEYVMEQIAAILHIDPLDVRMRNAYKIGDRTPFKMEITQAACLTTMQKIREDAHYDELLQETKAFNAQNRWCKRGVGVVPVKFGISFTTALLNQGSSLVWIYGDGTISLTHGGVEMGQSINVKVARVVAKELGVHIDRIRKEPTNTKRVGNASPTAASSGTDLNGNAALHAAKQLKERLIGAAATYFKEKYGLEEDLKQIVMKDDFVWDQRIAESKIGFGELCHYAYLQRIDLGAHGFYATPGIYYDRDKGEGTPFYYFVHGAAVVLTETDLLLGRVKLLKAHIIHETGYSLDSMVDRGQIMGAFLQGVGWCTIEEEVFDKNGRYMALTPSTYKIPTIHEMPEEVVIDMVDFKEKPASVFGSKGIGEPPLIYGEAVWMSILHALQSIAEDPATVVLAHPATPEAILMAAERINRK